MIIESSVPSPISRMTFRGFEGSIVEASLADLSVVKPGASIATGAAALATAPSASSPERAPIVRRVRLLWGTGGSFRGVDARNLSVARNPGPSRE